MFSSKYGDWCATEVNDKGKMTKYAFCKKDAEPKSSVKLPPPPKKAPVKSKKVTKPKSPSPKSKPVVEPKKSQKKKFTFKVKDPLQDVDEQYLIKAEPGIKPGIWELPNRKSFPNWMYTNYKPYIAVKNSMKTADKSERFAFFKHHN